MSGYLQRLVERTLGSEAVVQPLIPARFSNTPRMAAEFAEVQQFDEPGPGAPYMVQGSRPVEEGETSTRRSPAPPTAGELPREKVVAPRSGEDSLPSVPLEDLPGMESGELALSPTLPLEDSVEDSAHPPSAFQEGPAGESLAIKPRSHQPQRDDPEPQAAVASSEEALDTGPDRQPDAAPILQPVSREIAILTPAETQPRVGVSEKGVGDAGVPNRPQRQPDLSLPDVNQPAVAERHSVSPTLPTVTEESRQTEPQPQPVIRVRIGRIEVRAVPSPPAPAPRSRTPRPAPALSLQEYLEKRNGGER